MRPDCTIVAAGPWHSPGAGTLPARVVLARWPGGKLSTNMQGPGGSLFAGTYFEPFFERHERLAVEDFAARVLAHADLNHPLHTPTEDNAHAPA